MLLVALFCCYVVIVVLLVLPGMLVSFVFGMWCRPLALVCKLWFNTVGLPFLSNLINGCYVFGFVLNENFTYFIVNFSFALVCGFFREFAVDSRLHCYSVLLLNIFYFYGSYSLRILIVRFTLFDEFGCVLFKVKLLRYVQLFLTQVCANWVDYFKYCVLMDAGFACGLADIILGERTCGFILVSTSLLLFFSFGVFCYVLI
eukprot:gene13101-8947_t